MKPNRRLFYNVLGKGQSTEAGLMITLTAETVGSVISGAVTLAASILFILGFRRPLMVLPDLESQILLKSDLRPSPIGFRPLGRPHLCPQDVLCLSQDEDPQSGKPSQRFPSSRGRGTLGAAVWDGEMGGGKDSSESSNVPPGQWLLGTQREVLSA